MSVGRIDVAIPTHESAAVLGGTLDALATSDRESAVSVDRLVVVDDASTDATRDVVREQADEYGWELALVTRPTTLPEARELAIDRVETEWFLFLDDDVRVGTHYLDRLTDAAAPGVGAIQGRKADRSEPASDWVRRRARRGGTHATLLRTAAARGVSFPADLHVLEDEFLRRHVESRGYLWVFNHRARFVHASMDRHPIGWQEGYLAGKYALKPFHEVALNVPFTAASGRNPVPHARRAVGWLAGRLAGTAADRERATAVPATREDEVVEEVA